MTSTEFERFLSANPPSPAHTSPENGEAMAKAISTSFGVATPDELVRFWDAAGSGYFAERRISFLGSSIEGPEGRSLIEWNADAMWLGVRPPPREGGPVFFAETCFGDQLGWRWENDRATPILLAPDTLEVFALAESIASMFEDVLPHPFALVDPDRWAAIHPALGDLELGHHYAPIVSPLFGGSDDPGNFMQLPARAHLVTAFAEARAAGVLS